MADVRLFPISRSKRFVDQATAAIAADGGVAADSWAALHLDLLKAFLDRGVPDQRVDIELLRLFRNAERIVDRRNGTAKGFRRSRRLHLVPPTQGDLFEAAPGAARQDEDGSLAEAGS